MMLLTYHNEGGLDLDDAIRDSCQALLEMKFLNKVENWLTCSRCAVFHQTPDGYGTRKQFYEFLCNEDITSADGLVVLFVSSAELGDAPARVEFKCADGTRGFRYVLPVRHTRKSGFAASAKDANFGQAVEKWKTLFRDILDRGKLDEWFAHPHRRGISRILDEVLRDVYDLEPLANLAILCQAWLVAHAENSDRSPQHSASLKQMGWLDWSDEDPDAAKLSEDFRTKMNDGRWWLECLGAEDWSVFQKAAQSAWGDSDRSKLDVLIGVLEKRNPLEVSVVADAYCQLAIKLGGKQCPAI